MVQRSCSLQLARRPSDSSASTLYCPNTISYTIVHHVIQELLISRLQHFPQPSFNIPRPIDALPHGFFLTLKSSRLTESPLTQTPKGMGHLQPHPRPNPPINAMQRQRRRLLHLLLRRRRHESNRKLEPLATQHVRAPKTSSSMKY